MGNGVIGLSVADELLRRSPSLRVTVIGPRHRSGGASAAAGAMLGCFGEITKYTLASDAGRAKFEIARAAHARWPELLERLLDGADSKELSLTDETYVILNGRSGPLDRQNFNALCDALDSYGAPHAMVEGVPGLRPAPDAWPLRAMRIEGEGTLDATELLRLLERSVESNSGNVVDATVTCLRQRDRKVSGVECSDGSVIEARQVVIAAGAFSTPLLDDALGPGTVQPQFAGSGVAFRAERVMGEGFSSAVRTVNRAGSCGLHVVPLYGAREYYGATNVVFRDPELRSHLGVCHFLAQSAMDQLDQHTCFSRIDEVKVGNRPVPLDGFPLIGPTSIAGLTVLTGTYRDGLHAAPQLASWAAALIIDGRNDFPAIFAPERRPIETMSVQESIEEFVLQSTSSMYESGTVLPRFTDHEELGALFEPKAYDLYDQIGDHLALHPDLITYLTMSRKDPADVEYVAAYLRSGISTGGT